MTEAIATVVETPSYLAMSDAEVLAAGAPVVVDPVKTPEGDDKDPGAATVVVDPKVLTTEEEEEDLEDDLDDKEKGAEVEEGDKPDADAATKEEKKPDLAADAKPDDKPKTEVEKDKEAAVVDFEAEYKRLLTPFKANGRDIAVTSVDDAIALMQMGANYNKKMAALKPNLKLMKLLENSGFMNEEKIGFLIDLGKKDPAAINKLVKESGIDPMDLNAEEASKYKPTTRTVDDREIELDTVLDDIQGTETYTRTLEVVSTKWDAASKQVVAAQPQLLKVINEHMSSGIYDLISKEVESERVFGRLNGLSDIEAYRQVGDALQARGGFDHLGVAPKAKTAAPVVVVPKPKAPVYDKLNDKRRAASSTKPAAPSTPASSDFNPLSLSDEEFSKLTQPKFH